MDAFCEPGYPQDVIAPPTVEGLRDGSARLPVELSSPVGPGTISEDTSMRRTPFLLIAVGLVLMTAAPAAGAPTSSDPTTAAKAAAVWLAHQVNPQGFIPSATDPATPNLSGSAQAVIAMAAAGVGRDQVDAVLGYLATHIDAFVVRQGIDDAGALSYLILAVQAGARILRRSGRPTRTC